MKTLVIRKAKVMQKYSQAVWELLQANYADVTGGLHYTSIEQLINTSAMWKVALHKKQVVAVTIYKAKKGLKLVALAACQKLKKVACIALSNIIRRDLKSCWMELSERAERFVMLYCGGQDFIISNELAAQILEKQVVCLNNGYHYLREINNQPKSKLLLGTVIL
ncbi:hypothetical protein VQ643_15285 [Pseudomonas sp. F1_0610]|uniref:hypothetical protein n=1 Tax=Pseudomonas sp. F1_0610 TaxID=3114284 RepID=UPI0039C315CA